MGVMKGLFNRVRLSNNVEKMVGTTLTTLVGGVQAVDDGRRPVVPDRPKGECPLPRLLFIPDGQVTGGARPVPARDYPGVVVV